MITPRGSHPLLIQNMSSPAFGAESILVPDIFCDLHTAVFDNCISVQVPAIVGDDPLDCFRLHSLATEQMDMIEAKQLTASHNGRMIIEGKEELLTKLIYKSTPYLLKEIKQGIKAGFSSANHCVMFPGSIHFG